MKTQLKQQWESSRILRSQKGLALMLAIFCVVLITHIVMEISYETNIEYLVNAKSVQRVKAYYAAKSAVELSLLRIKIYNQVQQQYGENLKSMGAMSKMVEMIWSMPFIWPPIIPPDVNAVDKDNIEKKVKESTMDGTYQSTIMDEGTKIDINDLDSPSKTIREITKKLLLKIFESKNETDENWRKRHQSFDPEILIDNMIDWLDSNREAIRGGAEGQFYGDFKDLQELNVQYPPNRHFRSVDELRLVWGMTDEFYQLLLPNITVFGSKAINPNSAPVDLIKALDKSIDEKVIAEFQKRRGDPQLPPFTNAQEFWNFLEVHGARIEKDVSENTPLTFAKTSNFRIKGLGEFKGAVRQIEVIVFDVDQAITAVAENYKKDAKPEGAETDPRADQRSSPTAGGQRPAQSPSKGPPRIVYWTEN